MLGKTRAVEIIEAIRHAAEARDAAGRARARRWLRMDRLADAIVSVEYYMETLQAGRSDPWYMLDNADSCAAGARAEPAPAVPTVPPIEPGSFAQTVQRPGARPG
jgi:chemosensory pili system protein ChpA (sensor histidine kinase/response regulator)